MLYCIKLAYFLTSFEVNKPQYGQFIIFLVLRILPCLSDYATLSGYYAGMQNKGGWWDGACLGWL